MNAQAPITPLSEAFNLTLYRFANEPVRAYPFPHLYLTQVFHPDIHERLHACWPAPGQFITWREAKNIERERFFFRFEPESLAQLDLEQRTFWEAVAEWLRGPRLFAAVFTKYAVGLMAELAARGIGVASAQDLAPLVRINASLVWDITGYRLAPHADDPRVLLNLLFYLPVDESQSSLGTTLYLPKDPAFVSTGQPRHDRDRFEAVATLPYLPNTLFSFQRTPQSFHGMEGIPTENTERKLMFYSVMLKDDIARAAGLVF